MFMEPNNYQDFEHDADRRGRTPATSRWRGSTTRSAAILTKKFELGLFEHPYTDRAHLDEVGSPAHRAVARQAVAKSQVLLKNKHGTLPLRQDATSTSPAATPTTSATRPAAGR